MDYVLTDRGGQFLCRALATCDRFGVTWEQLWSTRATEAEAAREFLEFDPKDPAESEETGKLLGAAAVVQMLQNVASGQSSLEEATTLLDHARLLTDANIAVAADTFGLSAESVRNIFVPGS
jgi:hypothetical protein